MSKQVLALFPTSVPFSKIEGDIEDINPDDFDFLPGGSDDGSLVTTDFRLLENYPLLKQALLDNFTEYSREYLTYDQEYMVTTSWMTGVDQGTQTEFHNHKNCFYSGVYYFEDYDSDSGRLEFLNPLLDFSSYNIVPREYNDASSLSWSIPPEKGKVVYFPSYLKHRVTKHDGEDRRHSIAFNLVPTGSYGTQDSFHNTNWHT